MPALRNTLAIILLSMSVAACDAPTAPGSLTADAELSVGGFHACRTINGSLWCWGDNRGGQTGQDTSGSTIRPIAVPTSVSVGELAAGTLHTCGLAVDGMAYCWGANLVGEFGNGTTQFSVVPLQVTDIAFKQLVAGNSFTCGLATQGSVYCWGANDLGQLGVQDLTDTCGPTPCSTTPIEVNPSLRLHLLDAGDAHVCGLTSRGAAYCWGRNAEGALGNGQTLNAPTPVLVEGNLTFVTITAGAAHTCGIDADGILYCWGRNDRGQLGTIIGQQTCGNAVLCAVRPVAVSTQLRFVQVSAGGTHTCAITDGGVAYCWGANRNGQLGNEDIFDATEPQRVLGGLRFAHIEAGALHTCALTRDGQVYCWGDNLRKQLGNGGEGLRKSAPDLIAFETSP